MPSDHFSSGHQRFRRNNGTLHNVKYQKDGWSVIMEKTMKILLLLAVIALACTALAYAALTTIS